MSSWLSRALLGPAVFAAACGTVSEDKPDAEMRQVACNGGAVDALQNGNFDSVDPPWRQDPPNLLCGMPRITPDSGMVAACLGGGGDGTINTVSRDIFLPKGAIQAKLTGKICIATAETAALDNDIVKFELLEGAVSIATIGQQSNRMGADPCVFMSFSVEGAIARDPAVATFRIQSKLNVGLSTSFYVDSLALSVSCAPGSP